MTVGLSGFQTRTPFSGGPVGKIIVLPEILANRIAAGEVVERPASVFKELAENSLDAGAKAIATELETGGRSLIRVSDNGEGMDREDLLLAVERHATSKLSSAEELEAIRTLGFRGEALSAIASVSMMSLTSCAIDGSGWRLQLRGGTVEGVEQVPASRGTVVEVLSLFFNTPARRKFLRSEQRETALVAESVASLALAHPGCGFTLVADGRELLAAPASASRWDRVRRFLGPNLPLLEARYKGEGVGVEGLVSGAGDSRSDRSGQRILVNGRPVRDRMVSHAITQVYGAVLPPGRFPVVTLYIDLPAESVDVNVHPAKSEVRFRRPGDVHHAVVSALKGALGLSGALKSAPGIDSKGLTASCKLPERALPLARSGFGLSEALEPFGPLPSTTTPSAGSHTGASFAAGEEWSGRRLLGQYRDSYILASDEEGLLIVDQHAAHERVLYERLLRRQEAEGDPVQPLLAPVLTQIGSERRALLEASLDELAEIGLEVEPFGQDAAVIRAIPSLFVGSNPSSLLADLLEDLARERRVVDEMEEARFPGEAPQASRLRRLAAAAACQGAVKVNFRLTPEKMGWLLEALAACRVPTTCPHGRPTTLRMAHAAIERSFLR